VSDHPLKSNLGLKSTPSAKGEAGSKRTPHKQHHLNRRAVVILVVFVLVGSLGFFFAKNYQAHHQGAALLAQAKQFLEQEPKQPNLALTYLNSYLDLNPKDMDALDLKSKLLFDLMRSPDQAQAALASHDVVVRNDPQNTRQETRRRRMQLNLIIHRWGTALTQAFELVKAKNATAVDYQLLGDALRAQGNNGVTSVPGADGKDKVDTWDEAIKSYEEAQRLEPSNVYVARNLASLYLNHRNDPKQAVQVLDKLLEQAKTNDEKALVHAARYDYFADTNQADLARAELEQAVQLKPNDPDILLKAAFNSMLRGDNDAGRKYIDAIPGQMRTDLRRAILGEIDVREKKLDAAIQDWREGLKATGGTSDVLTWRLAYMLLRLGRLSEAEPLVAQYHRLTDRPDLEPIPKAVYLDALVLLKMNKAAAAIPLLEKIRFKTDDNTSNRTARRGLDDSTSLGAEVAFTLGQCYELIGKDQQALDAYRDAAKIVRDARGLKWADPWIGAANTLQRANRLEDAAAEIEDGLVAIPNDSTLLINLGRIRLVQQARLPKDRRAFSDIDKILEEARKANPTSLELIKLQIPYLATAGRLDEAAVVLAAATDPKHKPLNPELWALQAEVLRRLGEPAKAIEALDRGTAAIGEHALLRIARAEVLNSQGRDVDAYETLEEGIGLVPPEERPRILKALGDMHRRVNDLLAARKAYAEWAKLAPQDPQPQLLGLELALAADDEPAIRASVAAAKKIGGLAEQFANALVLLKDPPDPSTEDQLARDKRLATAGDIINTMVTEYPGRPTGYLLRAQLLEKQDRVDEAIQAYRQAREHNGGPDALRALFILLARQRRFAELRQLRTELYAGELTPDLEWLVAGIALALGEKDQAEQMVQQVVHNDPQGLSTRLKQVGLLNALGKPKEAEEILLTLIQQRPDELEPRMVMLRFQIKQKQFQKAAEVVEQIRAHVKTDRPEFLWADCYAVLGDMAKANEYYKVAIQKWPTDQEVLQRAVAFFRATGRNTDAEAALRELLKREPKHAWGRRELAQLLSARKGDVDAWNEAIKLIGDKASDSDTSEDRLVRATVLLRAPNQAHTQEATRILEELVAGEAPGAVSTMAHELLARLYTDANQLAKARTHAQAAAARSNDPNLFAFYAELLLKDKQPVEAGKQVDHLAQLEPDSLRVLDLRSRILVAQDRTADAASLLENTFANVEKLPEGDVAGRKIVELLIGLNQVDAAEKVGRRLADLWPKSSWTLSLVLARQGKLDEALKFCRAAVAAGAPFEGGSTAGTLVTGTRLAGAEGDARLKQADVILDAALKQLPNNITLLFLRAAVDRAQGRYADAAQLYRGLLAQNPNNVLVLNNMAWTLSEDLNQPAEGLERIDAAIERIGRQPPLLDTRGVILTRLGKFDQAISDLEAAVQASPTAAAYYYHLARAYHNAGRTAEFQKYRARAKETGLNASLLEPSERVEMDKLMIE
jgi:cellulose synthase operon protein C